MRILGIDPAIRTTGYGVVEQCTNGSWHILDCGVIRNTRAMSHSECLRRLAGGVRELVNTFAPDAASMEDPFVGKNAATAIILGMARGVIIGALAELAVPVYSYSPTRAKQAAVGTGRAQKNQVALMMAARFEIEVGSIPLDATDALALAICHGQYAGTPELARLLTKTI